MTIEIWCSDKVGRRDWKQFQEFVQAMANRLGFGYPEYEAAHGGPSKSAKYMDRIGTEFKVYRRKGNREHLINTANYAYLETQAPQHPKFHWDKEVANCMDCKHHLVVPDPAPDDWFEDDDVAVVCRITPEHNRLQDMRVSAWKTITMACRPHHARDESKTPEWCPLVKKSIAIGGEKVYNTLK